MINIHKHVHVIHTQRTCFKHWICLAWMPGHYTQNSSKNNKVILNISFSLAYFIIEGSLLLLCRLKNIIQYWKCIVSIVNNENIRRMCISQAGKRAFIIYLWLTDIKLSEMEHFEMVMNGFCFSHVSAYIEVRQCTTLRHE